MPQTQSGYTLIETLVSLVVISLIALGVAAVLHTAAYGSSARRETRRVAVRGSQVHSRMNDAVRNARSILAAGGNHLVLWAGDTQRNDQVNLSEIQFIELASGSTRLTGHTWNGQGADALYAADADFYAASLAARQQGKMASQTWSDNVSGLSVTLHGATPQTTRLLTWSLQLRDQDLTERVIGSAALRCPGTPK